MNEGGTSLNWEAPALVLSAVPYGESDLIVHVFTRSYGVVHGLVRGGASRKQIASWQVGTLIAARWKARLERQLGTLTGEVVRITAANLLNAPLGLAMLISICAIADGALPERDPFPDLFDDTVAVLLSLSDDPIEAEKSGMALLLRWEMALLGDIGFSPDLSCCAVTGAKEDLVFVSPKTGRAVSREGAGAWASRLLPLPCLFTDSTISGTPDDWRDGLRLTGHFLAREAFGQLHRPMPAARIRLIDRISTLCEREGDSG